MKKQVLLADEDEAVRRMVARVLESAGYEVALVHDGSEALARFSDRRPDLVLLDLRVPDEAGWAACERIRRSHASVPVIVMTTWPNQCEQAVQRGIDALMEKPLDLPRLLQTIERLLEASQPEPVPGSAGPCLT